MPARKIIPKGPATEAEIAAVLGDAVYAPELAAYALLLRRYGGGFVFPNTLTSEQPLNPRFSDLTWSVQYFRTAAEVMAEHDKGLAAGWWRAPMRPVAVIAGGDLLLLSLARPTLGQLFFWTPEDDGISYREVPVAAGLEDLLARMDYVEEAGMTPPWRRMQSVDDAPAVDLSLAP